MSRINKFKDVRSHISAMRPSPTGHSVDPEDESSPFIETKKFKGITYEKTYTCFSREKAEHRKTQLKAEGHLARITEVPTGEHPIFFVWKA